MNPNQGKPESSANSALSAKALEYYRMYSANDELPKYFCGTYDLSSSAMTAPTSKPLPSRDIPEIIVEECEVAPASPTSSITSAKKLEWDSGADIGYANYDPNKCHSLHKSSSMPILKRAVNTGDLHGEERISEETEENEEEAKKEDQQRHKELMTFLRMKVGVPTAESTPVERSDLKKFDSDPEIYSQTPRKSAVPLPRQSLLNTTVFTYEVPPSNILQGTDANSSAPLMSIPTTQSYSTNASNETFLDKPKYSNRYRQHKLKSLHISPPISIECLSNIKKSDIQTQTTILESDKSEEDPEKLSRGIQTSRRSSKQEIVYLFHPSLQYDDKTTSSGCSNPVEIIDDRVFSNCNSFEYLAGNSNPSKGKETAAQGTCDKTSSASSTNQSNGSLRVGMEKSLKIMEKLIKSTKYDDGVKQMYIRKMARKIVQINPGSEQSSDSSKIVPKIAPQLDKDKDWSNLSSTKVVTTGSGSNSSSTKAVGSGSHSSSTKAVKNISDSSSTKAVKSISGSSSTKAVKTGSDTSSIKAASNGSNSGGKQSWKNSLTLSEKLYSSVESTDSPKEALVSFAKRERESQLCWINNEIEHLAKLKSLLESKRKPQRPTISASVPNIPSYKKSTAVYMITTDKQPADCADDQCTSKTKKSANGRIDFHVHDNLGVRDYQFKEIITRITPEPGPKSKLPSPQNHKHGRGDCPPPKLTSNIHNLQTTSHHNYPDKRNPHIYATTSAKVRACSHIPVPNPSSVSEHPTCPAQCYKKCHCTPTSPDHKRGSAQLNAGRSGSSSPPDSSITDDTSGYPARRRYHQAASPTKKGKGKGRRTIHCHRRDCSSGLEDTYLPGKCQDVCKPKDSDSDSSRYESLTKYPTEPDSAPANISAAKPPIGRFDYINVTAERQAIHLNQPSTSILVSPTKKGKSYKDYKASKLKEKEFLEKERLLSVPQSPTDDHAVKRPKHSKHKHLPPTDLPSENEIKSMSEEDIPFKHALKEKERKRRSSKTRVGCGNTFMYVDRFAPKEQEFQPGSVHNKLKQRSKPLKSPERTHTMDPTMTEMKYALDKNANTSPTPGTLCSCDNRYITDKSITPTKFKKIGPKESGDEPKRVVNSAPEREVRPVKTKVICKTDTEVPSIEQFTNTDVVWESINDEGKAEQKRPAVIGAKERLLKCTCSDKLTRRNSVSQQTRRSVQHVEKGVMMTEPLVQVDGKEIQVDEVKPVMRQKAVGDDTSRTRKEIASQIANGRVTEAGLSLTSAEVVTYLPLSGDNSNMGKPYKMVKDISELNLNSALVISSVVTTSASNPDGHIRRLVLEMPLKEQKDVFSQHKKGVLHEREMSTKSHRKAKKNEAVDNGENELSLHSCFCTHSEDTTAGSTTDVMCSCCGKGVPSEKSFPLGDKGMVSGTQGQFCWPCYCQSAKSNWNPQEQSYYQQPDMMCNCYSKLDENSALEKIRDTLRQLAEIDKAEEEQPPTTSNKCDRLVCNACNKKIKRDRDRDQPLKKPVAYVLKFEPGDVEEEDADEKPSVHSLQEIRVKVPVKQCKKAKHKHKGSDKCDESRKSKECEICDTVDPNLQEYLATNRPDFVQSAEERRRCMIELAYMREQRCQKYKELVALSNGFLKQNPAYLPDQQHNRPRLFSTKDMKRLTAKKYKKLPEVQQKLLDNKNKQMLKANRLLADIFNKKLQGMVLRGQASLSTSISLINLM